MSERNEENINENENRNENENLSQSVNLDNNDNVAIEDPNISYIISNKNGDVGCCEGGVCDGGVCDGVNDDGVNDDVVNNEVTNDEEGNRSSTQRPFGRLFYPGRHPRRFDNQERNRFRFSESRFDPYTLRRDFRDNRECYNQTTPAPTQQPVLSNQTNGWVNNYIRCNTIQELLDNIGALLDSNRENRRNTFIDTPEIEIVCFGRNSYHIRMNSGSVLFGRGKCMTINGDNINDDDEITNLDRSDNDCYANINELLADIESIRNYSTNSITRMIEDNTKVNVKHTIVGRRGIPFGKVTITKEPLDIFIGNRYAIKQPNRFNPFNNKDIRLTLAVGVGVALGGCLGLFIRSRVFGTVW